MNLLTVLKQRFSRAAQQAEPLVSPEAVIVTLPNTTEAAATALEQNLNALLSTLPATTSGGIDEGGSDAIWYIYSDDATSAAQAILPALRAHPLSQAAHIRLQTLAPGSTYEMQFRSFDVHQSIPDTPDPYSQPPQEAHP